MGESTSDLAHLPLRRAVVVETEPGGQVRPQLGSHPVGGAPGELVQDVADVEQRLAAALEVGVGHVDQPGGHQGTQHRGVAQSALGLLEVGHGEVGKLADHLVPRGDEPAQLGQPGPGATPPLGEHRGAEPQREVGVTRDVTDVEQAGGHADVRVRGRRHLGQRAHRVVEPGAVVPQRVPDLGGDRGGVDALVVHEHDVEVGVGGELGAAVAADGDQRHAGLRPPTPVVGGDARPVGRRGAGGTLGRGQGVCRV